MTEHGKPSSKRPTPPPSPKVGRNDPCPCRSGKKFKKCCLNVTPLLKRPEAFHAEQAAQAHRVKQAHVRAHGHAREAVWAESRGRKVMAVGSTVIFESADRPWRTFPDFLLQYCRGLLGQEWANRQTALPAEDRHPVFKMHEGVVALLSRPTGPPDENGVYKTQWDGNLAGFLTLAHDLYTVADNAKLQERLLDRLRHRDQYQGARYELFVIATCVRAGFSVEYEDETDASRKHAEFLAVHRTTGARVAVEAKSRHRDGVLGFRAPTPPSAAQTDVHRARLKALIVDAIKKDPGLPLVIFVDVNLPGFDGDVNTNPPAWFLEVGKETLPRLAPEQRAKVNLLICTNIAFHYTPTEPIITQTVMSSHDHPNPTFPTDRVSLEAIVKAAQLFRNVPKDFPRKAPLSDEVGATERASFIYADGRRESRDILRPLPETFDIPDPQGPGLIQLAAGLKGRLIEFRLRQTSDGLPLYVETGAAATAAHVSATVSDVRKLFDDLAASFQWSQAVLSCLITPEQSFWIDYSWSDATSRHRLASGWITQRHTADHGMAFVEAVLGKLYRLAISVGDSPVQDGRPINMAVIPPDDWWTPPGSISTPRS